MWRKTGRYANRARPRLPLQTFGFCWPSLPLNGDLAHTRASRTGQAFVTWLDASLRHPRRRDDALVNGAIKLEKLELSCLESVAEGRASAVPEPIASRLLAMGLVQEQSEAGHSRRLQLTPKGLSFIRSSDQ
jgi:hypothetical protein